MGRKIKISDETPNSKGFILATEGGDFTGFKTNPVMLDSHDPLNILGKWTNLSIDGKDIYAEPVFNEKKASAKEKMQEYNDGFLNGASIGVRPIGLKFEKEDFDFTGPVPVMLKWRAAEVSLCALPSNMNAIALYDGDSNPIEIEPLLTELKLSSATSHLTPTDMDLKKQLASEIGLSETASDADFVSAIKAMKTKGDAAEVKLAADNKAKALELVEGAIKRKLIKPDQKDTYLKKAEADYDFVKLNFDNMTPAAAPDKKLADLIKESGKDAKKKGDLSADRSEWNYLDWIKNDSAGLSLMETENPDGHKELLDAYKADVQRRNGKK